MVYNVSCRSNPIRQDFLTVVIHRRLCPPLHTGTCAEFMKGGMLMKSKHCANGKEIAICDFRDYHFIDSFLHKSRITASAKTVIL